MHFLSIYLSAYLCNLSNGMERKCNPPKLVDTILTMRKTASSSSLFSVLIRSRAERSFEHGGIVDDDNVERKGLATGEMDGDE